MLITKSPAKNAVAGFAARGDRSGREKGWRRGAPAFRAPSNPWSGLYIGINIGIEIGRARTRRERQRSPARGHARQERWGLQRKAGRKSSTPQEPGKAPNYSSQEKSCPEGAQACSRGWSEAEPPEEGEPQVSSPNGAVATLRRSRAAVALSGLSVSFGYPLPGLAKSRQPRATCLGPFRADHRFGSKESIHQSHRAPERCVTGRG